MSHTIHDVAIIGYGPAGATLANLLGQYGLSVLALLRHRNLDPARGQFPKVVIPVILLLRHCAGERSLGPFLTGLASHGVGQCPPTGGHNTPLRVAVATGTDHLAGRFLQIHQPALRILASTPPVVTGAA